MPKTLLHREEFASIQELQAGTSRLLDRAAVNGSFIRVLRNSKPVGVLMPNSTFESMSEDLLAMGSPRYLRNIRLARTEKKRSSALQVKKMLGL